MSESLAHHGIIGMKWGVRRYQNGDGSLTEDGKDRYGAKDIGRKVASGIKKASEWKRLHTITGRPTKNPKHLTDAELKARIDRLRNEEEYRRLSGKKTNAQKEEARIAAGRAFVTSFMAKLGGRVGGIGTNINKKIGDKFMKTKTQSEKEELEYWQTKRATAAEKEKFQEEARARGKAVEIGKQRVKDYFEEKRNKRTYGKNYKPYGDELV